MNDPNQEPQDWFAENAPQPASTGPTPNPASQPAADYDWFAANAPPSARKPGGVTSWRQDLENHLGANGGAVATSQPPARGQGRDASGFPTAGPDAGSGMKPETADFLRDLAGIGTPTYLHMRASPPPGYQQGRDHNFTPDGSGNFVSQAGQPYTQPELRQIHGLLSQQAGNPLISALFRGPKSPVADYMVWRNQNFVGNQGTYQDEDGTPHSEPELEKMFAAKSQVPSRSDKVASPDVDTGPDGGGSLLAQNGVAQTGSPPQAQQQPSGRQPAGQRPWQPADPNATPANPTFFWGPKTVTRPDPSWSEIREYVAQEAQAYGVPVKLAEAVAKHESNFDIHLNTPVYRNGKIVSYDRGVMQVNDSNNGSIAGPEGWGFNVDPEQVRNDWKYNVHVGMAILRNAYAGARVNALGEENIARETYARYNAPKTWRQLYTVPGGRVSQHVDQFLKSWHLYYDNQ